MLANRQNFCCDNLWKGIIMALENLGNLFSPTFSAGLTMAQVAHLRQGLCPRGPHNFTLIIFVHMKYTKNEDSSHTLSFLFKNHLILCSSKELHTK